MLNVFLDHRGRHNLRYLLEYETGVALHVPILQDQMVDGQFDDEIVRMTFLYDPVLALSL